MALFDCSFRPEALGKTTHVFVFYPDGMPKEKCPVLYLLHGLSDDYSIWLRWSAVERYAAKNGMAVVMPDAGTSWYCNQAGGLRYYDYVAKELPAFIQNTFGIGNDPKKCFIGGLSMGGYGAMKIALRNPGKYAAVAAFSGAYDLEWIRTAHTEIYEADFKTFPWDPLDDPYQLMENYPADAPKPPLYLVGGTQDSLFGQSTRMRDLAIKKGFSVRWEEEPMGHVWDLWDMKIEQAIPWMLNQ